MYDFTLIPFPSFLHLHSLFPLQSLLFRSLFSHRSFFLHSLISPLFLIHSSHFFKKYNSILRREIKEWVERKRSEEKSKDKPKEQQSGDELIPSPSKRKKRGSRASKVVVPAPPNPAAASSTAEQAPQPAEESLTKAMAGIFNGAEDAPQTNPRPAPVSATESVPADDH